MINDKILFIIDKDREFLFDGACFSEAPTSKRKNYLSASVLPSANVRTYGYKTPSTTSLEKIQIDSEMNMYEDAGLDPEVDFSISSLIIPLEDSEEFYVESYAAEVSILDEKFGDIVQKNSHLDLIFPPALSYSSIYTTKVKDGKNDLYIHIGDHNGYAVIFKNGQYISTRSISTLDEIARSIGLELEQAKEQLSKKGILEENYSDDEFIQMTDTQAILSKLVERVAHSIGHKRGVFKLNKIDNIYLDFEGMDIPGFLDLFNSYGYEEANKEVFDAFKDVEVGLKHYALNAQYALCAVQETLKPLNLTVYDRKPSFLKTKVGEFSMVMLLAFVLASIYPIYAFFALDMLEKEEKKLKNNVVALKKKTKNLHEELTLKRAQRDVFKEKKNEKVTKIESLSNMINALGDFDNDIMLRQKVMHDINRFMKKYTLSSKKIEFKNSKFVVVQIIASYDKRDDIAEFIKELISHGYTDVKTKKVQKNETYYESFVEIKL